MLCPVAFVLLFSQAASRLLSRLWGGGKTMRNRLHEYIAHA